MIFWSARACALADALLPSSVIPFSFVFFPDRDSLSGCAGYKEKKGKHKVQVSLSNFHAFSPGRHSLLRNNNPKHPNIVSKPKIIDDN